MQVTSGLTYNYIALNSTTDDVEFYNAGGTLITPVPDAQGLDTNVNSIKIKLKGSLGASSGAGNPSAKVFFRIKVGQ